MTPWADPPVVAARAPCSLLLAASCGDSSAVPSFAMGHGRSGTSAGLNHSNTNSMSLTFDVLKAYLPQVLAALPAEWLGTTFKNSHLLLRGGA
jgi:hypothetical protein